MSGVAVDSVSTALGSVAGKKATEGRIWAAVLAVLKTVLLLAYAGRFGFMSDELYFLDCVRHPAWCYADLPPLLPWLTWITTHTLGSSLWAVRVYPAVAAGVTVVLARWLAAELGGHKRAVVLAALFVFLDPVTFGFGQATMGPSRAASGDLSLPRSGLQSEQRLDPAPPLRLTRRITPAAVFNAPTLAPSPPMRDRPEPPARSRPS